MFLGTHPLRLDEKGRLVLPAKWRADLGEGLVITKGQERCLYVFTAGEFERISAALRTAPLSAKALRDYSRIFFSAATNEVPDRQGRVVVPEKLRAYAGLDRECAVIGANARAEIWDSAAWDGFVQDQESAYSDVGEEVLRGLL